MRTRSVVLFAVLALMGTACGDSGGIPEEATATSSNGGGVFGSDDSIPVTVGNLPGVSNECESLLNLFLGMGQVFLGGDLPSVNESALAGLPGSLQDDALLVLDTMSEFADGLQALGVDLTDPSAFAALTEEQQEEFAALSESFDSDEVNDAMDNLSEYGEQECDDFVPTG